MNHLIPPSVLPAALATGVVLAWLRLGLRQWRAPVGQRSRAWRMAALVTAQPTLAALLYLTLVPPATRHAESALLTVLTRGASTGTAAAAGGPVVALPEAAAGAARPERAPDLATALRRHAGIGGLQILGEGLEARDLAAAHGLAIRFDPPPLPPGLVELTPPRRAAPGGPFRVSGRIEGGGSVELIDPAGRKVAAAAPDGEGRFTLEASARLPGLALFTLRTRDDRGRIVSTAEIPLWAADGSGLRVLMIGGAPGPEIKFWRRWASDAGLQTMVHLSLGANLGLGDPVPPLSTPMLARLDLLILDDRGWARLGRGERAAIAEAVRGGLGLLLRVTGPAPAGYGDAVGLPITGGTATAPVRLLGPDGKRLPDLTRRVARVNAADALPLLTDLTGATLAVWRAVGRGRVGAWFLTDGAGLVTSGHGDRYGELWADAVATLARAGTSNPPNIPPLAYPNQRITLCGVAEGDEVVMPNGQARPLPIDSAAPGCAGYWPRTAGWHMLRHGDTRWPFHVQAARVPGVAAQERRVGTLALVGAGSRSSGSAPYPSPAPRPGPPWPWFLALLTLATTLWWLERSPRGRPVDPK